MIKQTLQTNVSKIRLSIKQLQIIGGAASFFNNKSSIFLTISKIVRVSNGIFSLVFVNVFFYSPIFGRIRKNNANLPRQNAPILERNIYEKKINCYRPRWYNLK